MPNWSETKIEITGNEAKVEEIFKNVEKNGLDWGIMKMPNILRAYSSPCEVIENSKWKQYVKEFKQQKIKISLNKMKRSVYERLGTKYGLKEDERDWYSWAIKNWGTKWNIDEWCYLDLAPNGYGRAIMYWDFCSAWSGPDEWFKKTLKHYQLDGRYIDYELGQDFFVEIIVKEGEVVKEVVESALTGESAWDYYLDNINWREEIVDIDGLEYEDAVEKIEWFIENVQNERAIEALEVLLDEIEQEYTEGVTNE